MARIPFVSREDVGESEMAAYDAFVQTRGSVPNAGPYALLLHMPELAQKLESLRLCIRNETSLPQKLRAGSAGARDGASLAGMSCESCERVAQKKMAAAAP